jgi:hypothetical protein
MFCTYDLTRRMCVLSQGICVLMFCKEILYVHMWKPWFNMYCILYATTSTPLVSHSQTLLAWVIPVGSGSQDQHTITVYAATSTPSLCMQPPAHHPSVCSHQHTIPLYAATSTPSLCMQPPAHHHSVPCDIPYFSMCAYSHSPWTITVLWSDIYHMSNCFLIFEVWLGKQAQSHNHYTGKLGIVIRTSPIRQSVRHGKNVGLGGCWVLEGLLTYFNMVTVPHKMVPLEKTVHSRGVRLPLCLIILPRGSGYDDY